MKVFEVVLKGHPDKVCDIIAESIKDMLGEGVRTAVEVVWFNNEVIVGGEVSCYFNNKEVKKLVRKILRDLGYDIKKIKIRIKLHSQSQEISNVVGSDGAGDNGVFYAGYHKLWTPKINELKELADRLSNVALLFGYKTDGKFIAVYEEDGTPIKFTLNIASNKEKVKRHQLINWLLKQDILKDFKVVSINPKGEWELCGGFADTGLTGRKLACDNSCGLFHQGGGAFFGKDISKADYTVPIYLHWLAEKLCLERDLEQVELTAHSIIGDERIIIKGVNIQYSETVYYSTMKEFVSNGIKKMEWYGLGKNK